LVFGDQFKARQPVECLEHRTGCEGHENRWHHVVKHSLEQLATVAELEELTANPTGRAKGIVLEANLDTGRGPVATILVDKGELKVGDPIVAGAAWGRVRAMIDDKGQQVKTAGPSTPVQVLGLQSVPNAGDEFRSSDTEKTAKNTEANVAEAIFGGGLRARKALSFADVMGGAAGRSGGYTIRTDKAATTLQMALLEVLQENLPDIFADYQRRAGVLS
jgi:hypothetical protein